jgi:hypothetical protein
MSKIVAFRDRVQAAIATVEGVREVDWYDGLFDQQDIEDWSLKVPCVFVAVQRVPKTTHHSTGELNCTLKCVAVIVDQDLRVRDADSRVWDLVEKIADLVNLNQFGDPNAAPACDVSFERLRDPELRRDGVALGIVTWEQGFTIGTNRSEQHEYIYYQGERITQVPEKLSANAEFILFGTPIQESVTYDEDDGA